MPKSKKPRRKYNPRRHQYQSDMGAGVMDAILFRVEDWGSNDWELAMRVHLVKAFDAILAGNPTERDWSDAKTVLCEGWGTASQFNECSRIRREIKAANNLLGVACDHWAAKRELLVANVEAARNATFLIVDMWKAMNPGEVVEGCHSLRRKGALIRVEEEMEAG